MQIGLINDNYFSLNSLFRKDLQLELTPKECQFVIRGLKYAVDAMGLGPIKKRRDKSLYNNYSNQCPYQLVEYAVHLLLAFREKPIRRLTVQDAVIKQIFLDFKRLP